MVVNEFTNIIINIITITLLLILLITNITKKVNKTRERKTFDMLIIANIIVSFIDLITWAINGKMFYGSIWLNLISSALIYLSAPLLGLIWTIFVDQRVFGLDARFKKRLVFYLVPFLINAVVCVISIFVPIYFTVSATNVFSRCLPFAYIPFIFSMCFAIYTLILIIVKRSNIKKSDFIALVVYMILPIICTVVQLLFYGISLIYTGFALSLVMIYINIQNDINVTDYLTRLSNRSYLEMYFQNESKHKKHNTSIYGIMIDIDDFKSINDTYGHIEGDNVLVIVSDILRRGTRNNDFLCRFAGDEFVVIAITKNDSEIEELVESINEEKEKANDFYSLPYKINFSLGYTKYQDNESYESFIKRIDENMYIDKSRRKK